MLRSISLAREPDKRAAVITMTILACLNLVSLADRYALPGVLPLIKAEFGASDRALGTLSSAFFFMFMATSPIAGWMGDRLPRKPLIVAAALLTSIAMLLTSFSRSYNTLLIHQMVLGVGEAAFAVVTPGVIADLFVKSRRGIVMSLYSLTIPVGTAAGLMLPGIGNNVGWRTPLLWTAVVGAMATLVAAFFMNDPRRGAFDHLADKAILRSATSLGRNTSYIALVVGSICLAFAMVGTAVWLPSFLARIMHTDLAQLGRSIGMATVIDGTIGVLLGGFLVQRCKGDENRALYEVSGVSMFLALCTGLIALYEPTSTAIAAMLMTQILLFTCTAPMAVAMLQVVDPRLRATALAISLFLVHALGGSLAPALVGWIADNTGLRAGLAVALLPLAIGAFAMRVGAAVLTQPPSRSLFAAAGATVNKFARQGHDLGQLQGIPIDARK